MCAMTPTLKIREEQGSLTPKIVADTSILLTRAFLSDPVFNRLQPNEQLRRRGLTALFAAVLRDAALHGRVLWCEQGALAWVPVESLGAGLLQQALRGYYRVPLSFGFSATLKLQVNEAWCHRRLLELAPSDAAYIYSIGVDPTVSGHGIGSRLVQAALETMAGHHTHCALRTDKQDNVRFYEKLGFACVSNEVVPATNLPTWFFVRDLT